MKKLRFGNEFETHRLMSSSYISPASNQAHNLATANSLTSEPKNLKTLINWNTKSGNLRTLINNLITWKPSRLNIE